MPIELPAQLLELSGADAVAFAQAQFASDLRALATGHWQWSAWLTAQGRVRCWFALLRVADERLLLWLRGADAQVIRADLARFVFRCKVSVGVPALHVYGGSAEEIRAALGEMPAEQRLVHDADRFGLSLPDPERHVWFAPDAQAEAQGNAAALASWRSADIRAGLPELEPALQDQFLPQWLGLTRLGAVSVAKGCYPGQEIMARLHFKGGNKRNLYRIAWSGPAVPAPGTELRAGDTEAGTIVACSPDGEALATLRDEAATEPLRASGVEARAIARFA